MCPGIGPIRAAQLVPIVITPKRLSLLCATAGSVALACRSKPGGGPKGIVACVLKRRRSNRPPALKGLDLRPWIQIHDEP